LIKEGSGLERRGDWTGTYSGIKFYPLDPRPEDICLSDISHALSNICRFNGHTKVFYSLAAHCFNVYRWLWDRGHSVRVCLLGLLHDAAEAYICDIPRPLKQYLPGYKQIEERIMQAVYERFGIDPPAPEEEEIIKQADDYILSLEANMLMTDTSDWNLVESGDSSYLDIDSENAQVKFESIAKVLLKVCNDGWSELRK